MDKAFFLLLNGSEKGYFFSFFLFVFERLVLARSIHSGVVILIHFEVKGVTFFLEQDSLNNDWFLSNDVIEPLDRECPSCIGFEFNSLRLMQKQRNPFSLTENEELIHFKPTHMHVLHTHFVFWCNFFRIFIDVAN